MQTEVTEQGIGRIATALQQRLVEHSAGATYKLSTYRIVQRSASAVVQLVMTRTGTK